MKIKKRIILLAFGFGLLFWLTDTLVDYYLFYKRDASFGELLFAPSPQELYTSVIMLASFVIFRFVVAIIVGRQGQTEKNLREEEQRLHEAQKLARIGNWEWHLQTETLIWSDEIYRIFGVEPHEFALSVEAFENAIHPDDLDDFLRQREEMLVAKQITIIDHRIILPDGEVRYVQERAQVLVDETGTAVKVIGTAQDITDRVQAEKALRANEAQFRAFMDNTTALAFIKDAQGIHLYANKVTLEILNVTSEQYVGTTVYDFFPTDIADAMVAHDRHVLETGESDSREVSFISETGDVRYMQEIKFPLQDSEGNLLVGGLSFDITPQKVIERELRASEEKFRSIVENSQPVLFIIDRNGRFVLSTGEQLAALGLEPGQVVGMSALEIYAPYPDIIAGIQATWRGETVRETDLVVQNQKGEDVHFDIFYSPQYDAMGKIIGTVGMAVDMTQQHEAQRKLIEREEQFRQLAENIQEVYWLRELSTRKILYASPAYEAIWGRPSQSLIDHPESFLDSVHPDDFPRIQEAVQQQVNGRYFNEEFRIIRPDGELRWVRSRTFPVRDQKGDIYRLAGVAMDITELKESIIAEQEQRSLANALVETAAQLNQTLDFDVVLDFVLSELDDILPHDGASVSILNKDGTKIQVVQVCGCFQKNDPPLALHDQSKIADYPYLQRILDNQQSLLIPDTATHPLWASDPNQMTASFLGCPIIIEDVVWGILILISQTPNFFTPNHQHRLQAFVHQAAIAIRNAQLHEDVQNQLEQLHEAQARLLQSEKLAAIGELVAGIAHELNNPLTSIVLYAQLLELRGQLDEASNRDIKHLVVQAQRASSIVRGLLDFARQRPTKSERLQINDVVKSTVDLLAYELRTHNVEVDLQLDEDLPFIMGDMHQLQQVFVNLLNNAIQAQEKSQGQGMIILTTQVTTSRYLQHDRATMKNESVVRVIIEDNGPGISPAVQKRIFDPFFTTKEAGKGTGLGLSVCHGIISEHDGHIWVESRLGEGATFYIELPLATAVADPAPTATQPEDATAISPNGDKQRILLIDDEDSIRAVMSRILETRYQVDTANDGHSALQKVFQTTYDLLICDVHMPGMGGLDFYERWQEQRPLQAQQTPVLFITGDTISSYMKEQLATINAPSLAKPFEMEVLLIKVQALLNNH